MKSKDIQYLPDTTNVCFCCDLSLEDLYHGSMDSMWQHPERMKPWRTGPSGTLLSNSLWCLWKELIRVLMKFSGENVAINSESDLLCSLASCLAE